MIPIVSDDTMLPGFVKFVQPDGSEQIFDIHTGKEVIDADD